MRTWSLSLVLATGCFSEALAIDANDDADAPGETSTAGSDAAGESTSEQSASTGSGDDSNDSGDTGTDGTGTDDSAIDTVGDSGMTGSDSPDGPCNGMPCPVGCEAEQQGPHAYAVCGIGLSNYTAWGEASEVCFDLGGALVRIETAAENAAVKAALANHLAGFETAWMGANDRESEETWVWLDDEAADAFYVGGPGEQPLPPQEAVDWVAAEPNNEGPFAVEEDCGAVYSSGWLDLPCSNETPFVCEF